MSAEETGGDDALEHRLTRIERVLAIGFGQQIRAKREEAGVEDEVVAAILDQSGSWIGAGTLQAAVRAQSGGSTRTVSRRLTELVKLGALEKRGETSSTEYRSTGLFG